MLSFLTVLLFALAGSAFTGGLTCPCPGFFLIPVQGRVRFAITLRLLPSFLKHGLIIFLSPQLNVRKSSKLWLASTFMSSEDSEVSKIATQLSDPRQLFFYQVSERLTKQCRAQEMAKVPGAFLCKYWEFCFCGYPLWHFNPLNPVALVALNPALIVV